MNSQHKLAIVIPAYKISFFDQAMESIAKQTCKDFTLYIGDDAGPDDLCEIVNSYSGKINIVYKRFEKNLGRDNLVAQWNRCIAMIENEEWIWFFSDDDLMDSNCVELFYKHIQEHPQQNLLHFDIQIIDKQGDRLYKEKKFKSCYSAGEFFSSLLNRKVYSTVVEYIFRRESFEEVNGFQSFDLAWSSDVATWMKLALHGGINTIEGGFVKWRMSDSNITANSHDRNIVLRKNYANIEWLKWTKQFFIKNNLTDNTSQTEKIRWLVRGIVYASALRYTEKYKLVLNSTELVDMKEQRYRALFYWVFEELKEKIKYAIAYKGYS